MGRGVKRDGVPMYFLSKLWSNPRVNLIYRQPLAREIAPPNFTTTQAAVSCSQLSELSPETTCRKDIEEERTLVNLNLNQKPRNKLEDIFVCKTQLSSHFAFISEPRITTNLRRVDNPS